MTFFQCVAGLIISTLCRDFIDDPNQDRETRENVFKPLAFQHLHYTQGVDRYFGTFTRTFLTMFEILFANFVPSCRILVESVSEWLLASLFSEPRSHSAKVLRLFPDLPLRARLRRALL